MGSPDGVCIPLVLSFSAIANTISLRFIFLTPMEQSIDNRQNKSPRFVNPPDITIKIRLEKNGRGGKSVTVLFNFPHNPDYFENIIKKLKAHCATGGTYKNGQMEMQGDHREKAKLLLEQLGFKVKLAGG